MRRALSLQRDIQETISSSVTRTFTSPKGFPFFPKLPPEIRARIWEMITEDGRTVVVCSRTGGGLRSSVPPLLQVCSESRAVGLKHYALCFSGLEKPNSANTVPPRVYFNFDRDTLFFREDWNEGVDGPWSCISQFHSLINKEDLQKVKAVGFDLNAKICSSRSYSSHTPNFFGWSGLEVLYLGLEKPQLHPNSRIELHELQIKDYSTFMQQYNHNPCWIRVSGLQEDAAAVRYIKAETIGQYLGWGPGPDEFCGRLVLVNVLEL